MIPKFPEIYKSTGISPEHLCENVSEKIRTCFRKICGNFRKTFRENSGKFPEKNSGKNSGILEFWKLVISCSFKIQIPEFRNSGNFPEFRNSGNFSGNFPETSCDFSGTFPETFQKKFGVAELTLCSLQIEGWRMAQRLPFRSGHLSIRLPFRSESIWLPFRLPFPSGYLFDLLLLRSGYFFDMATFSIWLLSRSSYFFDPATFSIWLPFA